MNTILERIRTTRRTPTHGTAFHFKLSKPQFEIVSQLCEQNGWTHSIALRAIVDLGLDSAGLIDKQ